MSLKSDLIQALIDLSTDAAGRIYDEVVPQGVAFPFCALTELAATRPATIGGVGLMRRSTIRVAMFARTAPEREAISTAITAEYSAPRPPGQPVKLVGSTRVSSIRVEASSDEVALADGDNVIKGKGLDLFFVYY
jgi:hypothetical protein